jgi:RecB family exonuclease
MTAAAARLQAHPLGEKIVLVMPADLDPAGLAFLQVLAGAASELTVIASFTGDARADTATTTSLAALGLSGTGGSVVARTGDQVIAATDPDDEVRTVRRRVLTELATIPGHRIAVLYGSARPYARLVSEHFTAAGITHFGRGVRPASERIMGRAVLRLLELPGRLFQRADVMALVSDVRPHADGHRVPGTQWERISREAGVVKDADWDRLGVLAGRFRQNAVVEEASEDRRQWLIDRLLRDAGAADGLGSFVAGLRARLGAIDTAPTWAVAGGVLRALWDDVLGGSGISQLPEEERSAAHRIAGVLDGLPALDAYPGRPSLLAVREVLELELGDDLDRTGQIGVGVHTGPLSDAIGLDVDVVFVLGLAEGLTPARRREDPLIPDTARGLTGGALPSLRQRLDREHAQLLAALAGAQRSVLSFPRGDLRSGGDLVPSRWLVPTLRQLTGEENVQATTWDCYPSKQIEKVPSHAAGVESAVLPATVQEWGQQAALAATLQDPIAADALTLRRARDSAGFTRFDGNLTTAVGLPDPTAGRAVSPTSIESWVNCPHGYFMRTILGLSPVEAPEDVVSIAATDRGTLVHEILDRFISEHLSQPPDPVDDWTPADRVRLHTIAAEEFTKTESRGHAGAPLLWEQVREGVITDLDAFLLADNLRRRERGLTPIATELPFGFKGKPPVDLDLGDGRTLSLRGTADRLDRGADGTLVVVDYKTGSAKPFDGISQDDPIEHGHKLQLPVYALAARAELGEPDSDVWSEYWFTSRKGKFDRVGYQVNEQVLAVTRAALRIAASGIGGGLFPQRPVSDSGSYGCDYCTPDGRAETDIERTWSAKAGAAELAGYLNLIHPTNTDTDEGQAQ